MCSAIDERFSDGSGIGGGSELLNEYSWPMGDGTIGEVPAASTPDRGWATIPKGYFQADLFPSEPKEVPYTNGSNADELINASKDWARKWWSIGKATVAAALSRIHATPLPQAVTSVDSEPAIEPAPKPRDRYWQPTLIETSVPEVKGLPDVPDAFTANGMSSAELSEILSAADRKTIALNLAAQAAQAVYADALCSRHPMSPNFTDPVEADFMRQGQAAYDRYLIAIGGRNEQSFEEFMTYRRASGARTRSEEAVKHAYERGELTIELNDDVARELRELDQAARESEEYFAARMQHESDRSGVRAMRDAMRDRVERDRRRLIANLLAPQ